MSSSLKINNFLKTLGPGILFASTAIGVSHLVQSTQAGAGYGFTLLFFIVAANVFKFPFFEFGSRYATATGLSILDGYYKRNKWFLYLYLLITFLSMFFVAAAVCFVAAAFFENLFQLSFPKPFYWLSSLVLISVCFTILAVGKFHLLDSLIKIIGITLLISTLFAFFIAISKGLPDEHKPLFNFLLINKQSLPFIIALMGWMPTAVDLSAWNSLWTIERIKDSKYTPSLKETLFEFNFGYWISAILSLCFVSLGAFVVYAKNQEMPAESVAFAAKVISLFTSCFGNWSFYIIAISSFSIMFGTAIGVLDGYARALSHCYSILINSTKNTYVPFLALTALGGLLVIVFFKNNFKQLVGFATTLSFLIAPVIAVLNFKLVTSNDLKAEQQPKLFLKILSYGGIIFLSGFSMLYLYLLFKP